MRVAGLEVRLGHARRKLDRALEARERLVVFALGHQHQADAVVRLGEIRPYARRFAIGRERSLRLAAVAPRAGEIVVRLGHRGLELHRALEQRDRLVELAALRVLRAERKALGGGLRRRSLGAEQPLQHAIVPSTPVTAWPPSSTASLPIRIHTRPSRPICIPWRATYPAPNRSPT